MATTKKTPFGSSTAGFTSAHNDNYFKKKKEDKDAFLGKATEQVKTAFDDAVEMVGSQNNENSTVGTTSTFTDPKKELEKTALGKITTNTNVASDAVSALKKAANPLQSIMGFATEAAVNFANEKNKNKIALDDIMQKIMNREQFSFDLNGDALFNQYSDYYTKQAALAREDAIGKASAMTGGYGNSYSQSVGQQAYDARMDELNNVIPELYQMAYDKYNQEGQDLYNQYALLSAEEEKDYQREIDERNFNYQVEQDKLARADRIAAVSAELVGEKKDIPSYVYDKLDSIAGNKARESYLNRLVASNVLDEEQALGLLSAYTDDRYGSFKEDEEGNTVYTETPLGDLIGNSDLWETVYNGGINGGGGIDENAIVRLKDGSWEGNLDELVAKLVNEYDYEKKDAKKLVLTLQKSLGDI
jgi:hypothetical protein